MRHFLRITLLIIGGLAVLGGIVFFLRFGRLFHESAAPTPLVERVSRPHVVGDPAIRLDRVHLIAVYFVPRDAEPWREWRDHIEPVLRRVQAFHRLQFRDASVLTYAIHPEPVIGEYDTAWYDGSDTSFGNPHAWEIIRAELDRRLGAVRQGDGIFEARLVLYEGVGALGGIDQILVSSGYLRSPIESIRASAVFYHELGHVFGLKDAYTYEHGTPLDEDIMGMGRNRPIGQTYLSENAKKLLGIQ